jgi:hypothetical protein
MRHEPERHGTLKWIGAHLAHRAKNWPKGGVEFVIQDAGWRRSLDQNALSHAWYAQVARDEGEFTPEEVKRRCKFYFGLPILCEDEEMAGLLIPMRDSLSDGCDENDEHHKYLAMDLIKITSLMSTDQFSRYLEAVQRHYFGRVKLEFPDAG